MLQLLLCLVTCGCLSVATAAAPSIGTVRSNGEFRLDGATVHGNGTLFEGDLIETGAARSAIQLSGVQITLLPESRVKVYADHTTLERGSGLFRHDEKYGIESGKLRITTSKEGVVQVETSGPTHITVAARTGAVTVRSGGMLVASLNPGMQLAFNPETGASGVDLTGVLTTSKGDFYLTDETTNVTMQVEGEDLTKYLGKRVEVEGSVTSAVVHAIRITVLTSHKKVAAAVLGGVAVTGTVGGLWAAGALGDSQPVSPR